jgi:hypothetical protein
MVARKRTTTKTGKFTKSTRTLSSTGKVTYSTSSKPPGSLTRRTVSSSNGKVRTTYSTKMGGGWTNVTTRTQTLSSKPRVTKSKGLGWFSGKPNRKRASAENDDGEGGTWSWFGALLALILLPIILPFKLFGVWGGWIVMFFYYYYFFVWN